MQNFTSVTIIPWDSPNPHSEDEIRNVLAEENLKPYAWGNSPGDVYQAHTHGYHKVIYVLQGSITWNSPPEPSTTPSLGKTACAAWKHTVR